MQDAGEDSAAQREMDGAHILRDCPCDCKPLGMWENLSGCAPFSRNVGPASAVPAPLPSLRNNSAAIAFQNPDWTRWPQQDRAVEEVRWWKELRRCENVPDSACLCRSRQGLFFTDDHKQETGKMRIAQVAPLTEAVPPKLYGGTERVVHWLTEELVALGNDVTLFASGDSQTSAKLDATWPKALRLDGSVRDPNALHMVMLERVLQKCDDEEFDFLHFHLDYYPFSLFSRQPTPFLTTLHGRLDLPEHQP